MSTEKTMKEVVEHLVDSMESYISEHVESDPVPTRRAGSMGGSSIALVAR